MVVDLKDVVPFLAWLPGALLTWLLIVACLAAGATLTGWLVSALRHGPRAATLITGKVLRDAQLDWLYLSPRRVWALARLAIQESIRRRVVAVFAVFILILLFAGWFLDPGSVDPARLYLGSVLTITSYLVLLLALLLSSLSLPADIKNRTLHTVVTKPVRASEVVLGRIVGFTVVGTLLLVVMGAVNYVFVERGLTHTHQLTADNLHPVEGGVAGKKATLQGRTSRVHQHRHKVTIDANGKGRVEMEQRHTHELSVQNDGSYRFGPPEGMLLARVPVYGKLTFRDPSGQPVEKGINVGDEWTYRSFISGGTLAACVWTFEGITEDAFPAGLPVETNIEIFRTHKGEIEKGVPGSLSVRNPRTGKKVEVRIFEAKEFMIDTQFIPPELQVAGGRRPICSRISSTTGRWKSGCSAWRPVNTSGPRRPTCTSAPAMPLSPGTLSKAMWASGCRCCW